MKCQKILWLSAMLSLAPTGVLGQEQKKNDTSLLEDKDAAVEIAERREEQAGKESFESTRLEVGDWETIKESEKRKQSQRVYSWVKSDGSVIRQCSEFAFSSDELGVFSQLLSMNCDFLTFTGKGWEVSPGAMRSRREYLMSQSRWGKVE